MYRIILCVGIVVAVSASFKWTNLWNYRVLPHALSLLFIIFVWRNTRTSLVTMVGPGAGPPGWAVLHHVRYQECGLQVERLYQVRGQHVISWHPRHAANTPSYLLSCYQCLSDCQKVKSTWILINCSPVFYKMMNWKVLYQYLLYS